NDQFVQACTLWTQDKEKPLADVLVNQGWLTPEDKNHVDYLLGRTLTRHVSDARATLTAVMHDQVKRALAGVRDPQMQGYLADMLASDGPAMTSTAPHPSENRARYQRT